MHRKFLTLISFLISAVVISASPLIVDLKVYAVNEGTDGGERLVETSEARPGQLLEYRATFSNVSTNALRGVTPEIPVPEGLVILPEAVVPEAQSASLDGVAFVPLPLVSGNGEPVPAERIRSIRWAPVNLQPTDEITVSLRARVAE